MQSNAKNMVVFFLAYQFVMKTRSPTFKNPRLVGDPAAIMTALAGCNQTNDEQKTVLRYKAKG